jgi:YfiH family protein
MDTRNFVRREIGPVAVYQCKAIEQMQGVRHGFSTRRGGVSRLPSEALNLGMVPWDEPELVNENRRRFSEALGLTAAQLVTMRQTHSDAVWLLDDSAAQSGRPQADAAATRLHGVALSVQTADCFPLLIADPETGAIGVVHAGWRGTLQRIVEQLLRDMAAAFDTRSCSAIVAIGPAIRSCCFEVGQEVAAEFDREFPGVDLAWPKPDAPGKFHLDLRKALDDQFSRCKVPLDRVYDLEACTFCCPDEFFSYRREGAHSGRLMAAIARTGR